MPSIVNLHVFEEIKHSNQDNVEYWSARELAKILEYSEYRHFIPVIEKAKESCENAGQSIQNHFEDVLDMVEIGINTSKQTMIRLSTWPI